MRPVRGGLPGQGLGHQIPRLERQCGAGEGQRLVLAQPEQLWRDVEARGEVSGPLVDRLVTEPLTQCGRFLGGSVVTVKESGRYRSPAPIDEDDGRALPGQADRPDITGATEPVGLQVSDEVGEGPDRR